MSHIAIVIDWYGPYTSINQAVSVLSTDYNDGLYLAIGESKYENGIQLLQYVGISKDLSCRGFNNHHKLKKISNLKSIWLGELASTSLPGRKTQATDLRLDLAEWSHSFFLKLPLNEKKTKNPPKYPVTILNRWWFKDYVRKRKKRPHPDWPDIIEFWGREYGARLSWLCRTSGGRCVLIKPEHL